MRQKAVLAAFLLVVGWAGPALAQDDVLAKAFSSRNVTGTLVISSLDGSQEFVHDPDRAKTRFLPASTFKIPNTLIALETGALPDENHVIPWDGKDHGQPYCHKDQTLKTAFSASCVWFYQELARRVGLKTYDDYLKKMEYGNAKTGPDVSTFWLEGDIRISAVEQVAFLKKLIRKELPFSPKAYDILWPAMVVDNQPGYVLRGKTGWAVRVSPQVGWFVGWVESGGKTWVYAMNMVVNKPEELPFRPAIVLEALKGKGLIP